MGRGSEQSQFSGKLFYVKVVTKKGEDPRFELTEACVKDAKPTVETKLSGFLVSGSHKTFTSKTTGIDMDAITLVLEDRDVNETYKIDQLLSGTSRDILNKLIGVEEFISAPIEIRLYSNDKGYATSWVGFAGEKKGFNWSYDLEFTNAKIVEGTTKVKEGGKLVDKKTKNYLELNEFFIQEFKDKVVPKLKGGSAPARKNDGTDTPIDGPQDDIEEGGLPF